jgi:hypothetical protein
MSTTADELRLWTTADELRLIASLVNAEALADRGELFHRMIEQGD